MGEAAFWNIIELLNWKRAGDDEAVIKPAVKALAKRPVAEITAFEEILAQKLYALDTEAHARSIGEEAYADDKHFSVDWFLYARCCVVANGRNLYEQVLANPSSFPQDMEFEALLSIGSNAYEIKTKEQDYSFETSVSYETFSNLQGWKS
jgi:hypothetical protein